MKHLILTLLFFFLLNSCSDNFVEPMYEDEFSLREEAANFPWDLVSGKIAYNRWGTGVILIDCEKKEMKILKILPYLAMITWHYSGNKITGVDLGFHAIWGGESRPSEFYCIDLNGNNSECEFSPHTLHAWSNDGKLATIGTSFITYPVVCINEELFLSTTDYKTSITRPTWSPDNNYLVICGFDTLKELKKFDVNTKVGTTLAIADSAGYKYSFEDPIYSPDGNMIAYVYVIRDVDQSDNDVKEIWKVNFDGSSRIRLTTGYSDTFPAWSPDNSKIIFQRNAINKPNSDSHGIYIINSDGSGLQKILSNESDMPIWR